MGYTKRQFKRDTEDARSDIENFFGDDDIESKARDVADCLYITNPEMRKYAEKQLRTKNKERVVEYIAESIYG